MVGARVRRQHIAYAEGRGLSRRRACACYPWRGKRSSTSDGWWREMLAGKYPRYGHRTIQIVLERRGHALGTDRMYRLWRQQGLQLPWKRPPTGGDQSPPAYRRRR
jgi:putative transposase